MEDEFDLLATRYIGPLRTPITEKVHSNRIPKCAECGVAIVAENDSGWEVFVNGTTTQPQCQTCSDTTLKGPITKDGGALL